MKIEQDRQLQAETLINDEDYEEPVEADFAVLSTYSFSHRAIQTGQSKLTAPIRCHQSEILEDTERRHGSEGSLAQEAQLKKLKHVNSE